MMLALCSWMELVESLADARLKELDPDIDKGRTKRRPNDHTPVANMFLC